MAKVFVSVGTPASETQAEFRDSVVRAIEYSGLEPRLMDDDDWDYKNPLRGVSRAMDECSGTIVIAYARYSFPQGTELRKEENRPLEKTEFPTMWNHIEAAMAYERGLPLLVVAQNGLRPDALFEPTGDVQPFWCSLDSSADQISGFKGYLKSWKHDVEAYAGNLAESKRRVASSPELTLPDLLKALPWHQVLGFIMTLLGLLATAATFGYRVGTGSWPF